MTDHELFDICEEALSQYFNIWRDNFTLKFKLGEDTYKVILDDTDVEDEGGVDLSSTFFKTPEEIRDHVDILDACLAALADAEAPIDRLTTDGDGQDCEAIFRLNEEFYVLKVR